MRTNQKIRGWNSCVLRALLRLFLIAAIWSLGIRSAELRAESVSEPELKAAVVVQFLNYVKWPSGVSNTIGILGDDPVCDKLEHVAHGKTRRSGSADDLKNCKIVYVAKSERGNLSSILSSLADAHVLTVSDSDGFASRGGIIGLVMVGGAVRFEINAASESRAGVAISAKVKGFALRVINK